MSENYSPPLTLHRTGNPQMRAARHGTKDMWRDKEGGMLELGEPQGRRCEPTGVQSQADAEEEGMTQHMEGDQEPSLEAGWGQLPARPPLFCTDPVYWG